MVEKVSLRVGIDARPAAAGADSFKRSAEEIIRSAKKMGRSVEKAGDGFDKMKKAANDNSRVLAGTVQSVRDVETALNSLSRSAGGDVLPLRDSISVLCDKLGETKKQTLPIRLTPMTATCRVPPLSRVKLGIGWSRGVARDAEQ